MTSLVSSRRNGRNCKSGDPLNALTDAPEIHREIAFTTEGRPAISAQASIITEGDQEAVRDLRSPNHRIVVEQYTGVTSLTDWAQSKL